MLRRHMISQYIIHIIFPYLPVHVTIKGLIGYQQSLFLSDPNGRLKRSQLNVR